MGHMQYKEAISEKTISASVSEIQKQENYVKIEDISDEFLTAIVTVEDHRFYSHSGFDVIASLRAVYVNITIGSFNYGASTITQQLGRILYFKQDKDPVRKLAEIFVAFNLEKEYEKEEILELYVNIIYYGKGYYGIYEASHGYFDKEPSELTFDEATYLAGLPNAPSVYSVNEKLGEQRRQQVIRAIEKYKDKLP